MLTVNRSYRAIERRWLNEYLVQRYGSIHIDNEKRLHYTDPSAVRAAASGSTDPGAGKAIARLDAWLVFADRIEVWEASQWFHFGQLSKTEHYRALLPHTFEYRSTALKVYTWHALASHYRREINDSAARVGIEYNVYLPAWLRAHQIETQQLGEARKLAFAEHPHIAEKETT